MKTLNIATSIAAVLASMAALGGCATDGPATSGASVRAIVASQTIAPPPRTASAASEGATAVATYKNYVESFSEPRPAVNDSAFRR